MPFTLGTKSIPLGQSAVMFCASCPAQMLARVCPTAMVFTPSVDGISHNPAEHTAPADLVAGADVLLNVLWTLATDGIPQRVAATPAADGDLGVGGPA